MRLKTAANVHFGSAGGASPPVKDETKQYLMRREAFDDEMLLPLKQF